jgi:2-C-methyl-D-erythritol 4-phosphate cytidylyltransferase
MIKKIAVIVAAGNGTRMGTATPKQFLLLKHKPVLWHSIAAFQNAFEDLEIILVVSPEHFPTAEEIRMASLLPLQIKIVSGGKTRFESVRNGLRGITEKDAIVFIHDGVRCLVSSELIKNCFTEAQKTGSAVPVVATKDSLRMRSDTGFDVIDRNKIGIVQTPQTFRSDILLNAFKQEHDERFTDEATVVEQTGQTIHFISGEDSNIKITRPIDLLVAEAVLGGRERNLKI